MDHSWVIAMDSLQSVFTRAGKFPIIGLQEGWEWPPGGRRWNLNFCMFPLTPILVCCFFFLCCYTRCWYTSVSHLEAPLDENCSFKFQKLGRGLEGDFSMEPQQNMIVIPQGFIEGDQTLALNTMSVYRLKCGGKKERGRQGLLQCTYSTDPEKMQHFTTITPTFLQY